MIFEMSRSGIGTFLGDQYGLPARDGLTRYRLDIVACLGFPHGGVLTVRGNGSLGINRRVEFSIAC